MSGRPAIIGVVVAYLLVLLGVGLWGSRDSATVRDYFVAGKKLPSWVIAFSSNATGESAWLLLGLTGMGYAIGVHALWIIVGEVSGVAASWAFVARPFKAYTDRYDSITIPDYLTDRFQDRRHVFRLLSAVIILAMVAAYTAAQLTATGKAFHSFLGTSYTAGVWIGTVVVLFYTSVGGFKAVAYTDLLQGLLMLGCLLTLPVVGIAAVGGWGPLVAGLRAADPALLRPMGSFGLSLAGVISAAGFVGIGLAFLGAPQLLIRFMAARDMRQIVQAGPIAVLCVAGFDVGAVLAGMAGRVLFPALADPETVLPRMSGALLPSLFTGLFLVAVLAAIMSTVNSLLIMASSSVVRDVIQKILRPDLAERSLSTVGKLVTVVLGAVAAAFALAQARMIFWFVLFAWSGLACAFTPVVLCSLFWKRTTRAGAVAGMAGGFLATVLWATLLKAHFYNLYEMLPGFAVGFALTIVVSLLTRPPEGAAAEMEAVRADAGMRPRRQRARDAVVMPAP